MADIPNFNTPVPEEYKYWVLGGREQTPVASDYGATENTTASQLPPTPLVNSATFDPRNPQNLQSLLWGGSTAPINPYFYSRYVLPQQRRGVLATTPSGVIKRQYPQTTTMTDYNAAQAAIEAATSGGVGEMNPAVSWDTVVDPDTQMIVMIGYDKNGKVVDYQPTNQFSREPSTITPYQQQQLDMAKQEAERQATQQDWQNQWTQQQAAIAQAQQEAQNQQWSQSFGLQQQQLGMQQQQYAAQQAEQERQYRSQLAANPRSWLEYAAYTNQQPAIQPWMIPLMGQQYAGTVAGAPIPGWQTGAPTMAELPGLTSPSRQYQARMGQTAMAQYEGYEQARSGITPQELEFRLWSSSPPSGSFGGLRWNR